jgi:hypothetical protein
MASAVLSTGLAGMVAAQEQTPAKALIGKADSIPIETPSPVPIVSPAQALTQPQDQPATQAFSAAEMDPDEKWSFYGGTVLLHRSAPAPTPLITTFGLATILDASTMNFGWAFGFDIGGKYNFNERWGVDLRYFQVAPWTTTFGPVAAASSLVEFQGDFVGLGVPGSASAQYSSTLRSAELNARYISSSWWTLLAGFRYVNLDESLNTLQSSTVPVFSGTWNAQTSNQLFGGQLGLEGLLFNRGCLTIDAYAKAGIYGTDVNSFAAANSLLGGRPLPPFPISFSAQQGQVSFLGDGGLHATFHLNRWAAIEGGYQLMWLTGVALVSDQFHASAGPPPPIAINSTGFVFYQGATLALKISR